MSDLSSVAAIAQSQVFHDRVMVALALKARAVATAPRTPEDDFPRAYAVAIIRNPANYATMAAWVLATDPAIASVTSVDAITDAVIVAAVERTWPALAGLA